MNTNELLDFFTQNYAAKNEVLCKLPLNVPIETFWKSLLDRRKSKAVFLPLHNASGMPFWYVLTGKMISAGEKLSECARNNTSKFDPYKAALTPELNEEMFFTAFLEGAQINMTAAMEIAENRREPANVQEQIILNNKNAWEFMLKLLYKPIDGRIARNVSYLLTEDMAGNSDNYRTSDKVYIPAMEKAPYLIPSALQIPTLMEELYVFLADWNIHPLIKSAAAHGFILSTRPFADGDERLARMLSYAVLLRSGYDYFDSIPLSMVIARESFGYFRIMREMLSPESGGDLTYFMEYYMQMLVGAQDMLTENRYNFASSKERELAGKPLNALQEKTVESKAHSSYDRLPKTKQSEEKIAVPRKTESKKSSRKATGGDWDYTLTRSAAIKRIAQKVKQIKTVNNPIRKRVQKNLMKVLNNGHISFSAHDYTLWCDVAFSLGQSDRKILKREGIITEHGNKTVLVYNIFMPVYENTDLKLPELKTYDEVDNYLLLLECAGNILDYKLSAAVNNALEKNQAVYDINSWNDLLVKDNIGNKKVLERGVELGVCTVTKLQKGVYEIKISQKIFSALHSEENTPGVSDIAV